ncbi:p18 [Cryptophlebia peltastica nucleopolyhedrovirus]|uniref:p18 n=1 Tax=Cryptophlebia peltastica nucleopolyhedrovirus TaxID=2304025 RepID=A0A346RNU1_9ABAC|nr:p18 [Cryptophlebia peltastica nucleopolyhedrovirus]AXS67738.1 p18 [Cryptophlebia peltastica nucleopolyhedrovirus]
MKTINLFLHDMPPGVQNDKEIDENVIFFDGVIECVEDDHTDKYCALAECEKINALLMQKIVVDLLENSNGNYCKNHVLIDSLLMYKTYVELVDESAFGENFLESCVLHITSIFKLFRAQSRIVVLLPSNINWKQDNLSALLKHLLQLSLIEIA